MRSSVRRHRLITANASEIWGIVGRPELLHLWFPGVVATTVEGEVRTVTTRTGLVFQERIITRDPIQRRLQYRIESGLVREHLCTIDVIPLDEGQCLVTYSHDVEPSAMAVILGGATEAALAELAHQIESGTGPCLEACGAPAEVLR